MCIEVRRGKGMFADRWMIYVNHRPLKELGMFDDVDLACEFANKYRQW